MKITALCASPKGEQSVTYQYVRYLQKRYPEHTIRVEHIGARIFGLEKKQDELNAILDCVAASDAVLLGDLLDVLLSASPPRTITLTTHVDAHKRVVLHLGATPAPVLSADKLRFYNLYAELLGLDFSVTEHNIALLFHD